VADLEPAQAALLAGAIVNPLVLSPARPNARLLARQRLILRRMGMSSARVPTRPSLTRRDASRMLRMPA
jgi:membrane peptidoglycan carboxypeptidase